MADSKYAKLPGIDVNSQDVFESNDLPEDEQNLPPIEPGDLASESVERISISTDTAFKTFKGKSISTGKSADFSSNVGKSRIIGSFADQTINKIEEDGVQKETPQQKFDRLQQEMHQLVQEVDKLKENVPKAGAGESISPATMQKQMEHLQHQFKDIQSQMTVTPNMVDPQGALRKTLLTHLESIKPIADEKSGVKEGGIGSHALYELYYRPEQAQFSRNARIATLEERLERLENTIGKNFDKMNTLTTNPENKSLIGAVAILNSKLSLLDAMSTETVEARLNLILQKMQQVSEKKEKEAQVDPDLDNQKRISDLYGLVKKWETTVDTLPQIVDRLLSLKELHEQALHFSQTLSYLDTAQQEVQGSVASHGDVLKQLQTSLVENSKVIQQNVESIEKRLKTLEKS